MIYVNKVATKQPMQKIECENDFEYFRDCEAQKLKYPTSEAMEKAIKTKQMNIVIAGTMTGDLKRNNENVFSRSLLFIDFDEVLDSEEEFLKKVTDQLDRLNYCLYPTLKYKPVENIRYRLVIELDREVNAKEYEILLFGISKELGVNFTFDESNKTWSQGQGLPVVTEYSENVKRIYQSGLNPVPVDSFIDTIKQSKEWKNALQAKRGAFNKGSYARSTGERKYTGQLLEMLFDGENHGNRNNWWREMVDKMLAVDTPLETIATIMEVINDTPQIFPEPLEQKELETIYLSRIKNHVQKGGAVY